eukprot:m51a1_g4112 hypothetical protein (948) ;mRNA; r:129581-134604
MLEAFLEEAEEVQSKYPHLQWVLSFWVRDDFGGIVDAALKRSKLRSTDDMSIVVSNPLPSAGAPPVVAAAATARTASPFGDESLASAWAIREHVLPCVWSRADLVSLALAVPAAFAVPCVARILSDATPMRWRSSREQLQASKDTEERQRDVAVGAVRLALHNHLVWAVERRAVDEMRALCRERHLSGFFGGRGRPEAPVASDPLVPPSQCSAAPEKRDADTAVGLATLACWWHSRTAPPELQRELEALHCDAVADGLVLGSRALLLACRTGMAHVLGMLTRAPFWPAGLYSALDGTQSGGDDSDYDDEGDPFGNAALGEAAEGGHCEIVDALALAPFRLGHGHARGSRALSRACSRGNVHVVWRLGRPPYNLGREEALSEAALLHACESMSASVVEELAKAPYNMGAEDARAWGESVLFDPLSRVCADPTQTALYRACESGSADVVRALGDPPYCLGTEDAQLFAVLSDEPYFLGPEDARRQRAMSFACQWKNVAAIRALGAEPQSNVLELSGVPAPPPRPLLSRRGGASVLSGSRARHSLPLTLEAPPGSADARCPTPGDGHRRTSSLLGPAPAHSKSVPLDPAPSSTLQLSNSVSSIHRLKSVSSSLSLVASPPGSPRHISSTQSRKSCLKSAVATLTGYVVVRDATTATCVVADGVVVPIIIQFAGFKDVPPGQHTVGLLTCNGDLVSTTITLNRGGVVVLKLQGDALVEEKDRETTMSVARTAISGAMDGGFVVFPACSADKSPERERRSRHVRISALALSETEEAVDASERPTSVLGITNKLPPAAGTLVPVTVTDLSEKATAEQKDEQRKETPEQQIQKTAARQLRGRSLSLWDLQRIEDLYEELLPDPACEAFQKRYAALVQQQLEQLDLMPTNVMFFTELSEMIVRHLVAIPQLKGVICAEPLMVALKDGLKQQAHENACAVAMELETVLGRNANVRV